LLGQDRGSWLLAAVAQALALQAIPGVDITQSGVNDFNVNARGSQLRLDARAPELPGKRVLLPRSDRAAGELLPRLRKFGAIVSEVIAYRTSYATDVELASKGAVANSDAILFFSPSAVHAFEGLLKSAKLSPLADSVVVGAIGPVTSVALRNAGLRCDFQASEPSAEDLVATLAVHFEKIKVPSV